MTHRRARSGAVAAVAVAMLVAAAPAGCGDGQPPVWPPGAALRADDVGADAMTVIWPVPTDAGGTVERYRISRDGEEAAVVPASGGPAAVLDGLSEDTAYEVAVEAADAAGNWSVPLVATLRTADVTPPIWDAGCAVHIGLEDPADAASDLVLRWCGATDNDGVDHVEIRRNGLVVATAPLAGREHRIAAPHRDGVYRVAACDAAGNCTPSDQVIIDADQRLRGEGAASATGGAVGREGDGARPPAQAAGTGGPRLDLPRGMVAPAPDDPRRASPDAATAAAVDELLQRAAEE